MAVRSAIGVATYDNSLSGYTAQTTAAPGVLRQLIFNATGVDVAVSNPGKLSVRGGDDPVQMLQVKIPKAPDLSTQFAWGARVANYLNQDTFKTLFGLALASQTGFPSTLIDWRIQLARALVHEPPGLLQAPGSPGLVFTQIGQIGISPVFSVSVDAIIANGSSASVTLTFTPSVTGAFYFLGLSMAAGNPAINPNVGSMKGDWNITTTQTVTEDGTPHTYETITNNATEDVIFKRDTVPSGVTASVGTDRDNLVEVHMNHSMSGDLDFISYPNRIQWSNASQVVTSGKFTNYGSSIDTVSAGDLTMVQTMTNNTGSDINPGDIVSYAFAQASAVVVS